ncbi:2-dehydro-3-deoxygalactonokinase [Shimia sp.]|uniref:2-dehydro-3-deoxygalactonokinase n=1 Tax=Shimia sp. TaxID=1954381 RepID=UPI00329810EA
MNSVASKPALIGIDWGTSSLRAFLIGAGGEVLDQVSKPEGIMHVKNGDFEGSFRDLIGPWENATKLPVIASGMITSRNGWFETPYVSVPSGVQELAGALVRHKSSDGMTVTFVTGMTTDHDGAQRGGIITDAFAGSGTTLLAAAETGRIGIGMEIDLHYADLIVRRLQDATGETAVHAASFESFAAVGAEAGDDT